MVICCQSWWQYYSCKFLNIYDIDMLPKMKWSWDFEVYDELAIIQIIHLSLSKITVQIVWIIVVPLYIVWWIGDAAWNRQNHYLCNNLCISRNVTGWSSFLSQNVQVRYFLVASRANGEVSSMLTTRSCSSPHILTSTSWRRKK